MHGWGIGLRIQQISKDRLDVNQGSLYPALQRLEHRGGSRASGSRPRTTAAPATTRSPRKGAALGHEVDKWKRFAATMPRARCWRG